VLTLAAALEVDPAIAGCHHMSDVINAIGDVSVFPFEVDSYSLLAASLHLVPQLTTAHLSSKAQR
jgi:hypothetical protein